MTVAIALHSTSWRLPAGHRLMLTVAGADEANAYQRRQSPPPTLTLYCNAACPLTLDLPVMEAAHRPPALEGAFPNLGKDAMKGQRPTATALAL